MTPKTTPQETHELALIAQWTEEIATRIEMEYRRQNKDNNNG